MVLPVSNAYTAAHIVISTLLTTSRCTGLNKDLDGPSVPRTRAYTEGMINSGLDGGTLWDVYGIDNDIEVRYLCTFRAVTRD